jgi:hypothetical protein
VHTLDRHHPIAALGLMDEFFQGFKLRIVFGGNHAGSFIFQLFF